MNDLCVNFDLSQYFISINGSPTKKEVLVDNILKKYAYDLNETILIGDSINDYRAAKLNNIQFYGYNNIELKKYNKYIDSFLEARFWIQKL